MPLKLVALVLLALSCGFAAGAADPAAAKPIILLTGFDPFGGSSFNTSWDIVSKLDGQEINGFVIKTARLKVVYDKIDGPLAEAIEKIKPAAVVSFGEGTREIHVETIARNGYHPAKPHDNEGKAPPREKIVPGGADEIPTGLPADEILKNLKAAGINAAASTNAGGYLCNECFYRLMSIKNAPPIRGFIHVPVVKPGDEAGRKKLDDALRIVIQTIGGKK